MYQECPKCGFKNSPDKEDESCPQCGLIFDKWLKNKYKTKSTLQTKQDSQYVATLIQTLKQQLFYVPNNFTKQHF